MICKYVHVQYSEPQLSAYSIHIIVLSHHHGTVWTCRVTLLGSVTHTFPSPPKVPFSHTFPNGSLKCEKKKTLPTWCAILPLSSAILREIHFLFTSCAMLDEYGKYIIDNRLEKMMPWKEIEEYVLMLIPLHSSCFILPLLVIASALPSIARSAFRLTVISQLSLFSVQRLIGLQCPPLTINTHLNATSYDVSSICPAVIFTHSLWCCRVWGDQGVSPVKWMQLAVSTYCTASHTNISPHWREHIIILLVMVQRSYVH